MSRVNISRAKRKSQVCMLFIVIIMTILDLVSDFEEASKAEEKTEKPAEEKPAVENV